MLLDLSSVAVGKGIFVEEMMGSLYLVAYCEENHAVSNPEVTTMPIKPSLLAGAWQRQRAAAVSVLLPQTQTDFFCPGIRHLHEHELLHAES